MEAGSLVFTAMVEFRKAETWHQYLITSTTPLRDAIKSHIAKVGNTGLLDHSPWSIDEDGWQTILKVLEQGL